MGTLPQPYGFTGRRYDSESGLWYFRARYFDDQLGRFLGRDPLGYVDGMSLYNGYFVPNGLDPSGLHTTLEECLEEAKERYYRALPDLAEIETARAMGSDALKQNMIKRSINAENKYMLDCFWCMEEYDDKLKEKDDDCPVEPELEDYVTRQLRKEREEEAESVRKWDEALDAWEQEVARRVQAERDEENESVRKWSEALDKWDLKLKVQTEMERRKWDLRMKANARELRGRVITTAQRGGDNSGLSLSVGDMWNYGTGVFRGYTQAKGAFQLHMPLVYFSPTLQHYVPQAGEVSEEDAIRVE